MLFQGLKARVMYQMPSTAISWSVYEGFKHVINNYGVLNNSVDHPYDTLAADRGGVGRGGSGGSDSGGGGRRLLRVFHYYYIKIFVN